MLQFYYSLIVIFLLEVTGAILAFAFKEKAKEFLGDIFKRGYVVEYQERTDGILDWFQENVSVWELYASSTKMKNRPVSRKLIQDCFY